MNTCQQRFSGRTAVLTGSGRGQAWAAAHILAREGANVVLNEIDQERLEACVRELTDLGASCVGVHADVTREEDVDRLAETALDAFGSVEILVNNVGGTYPSRTRYLDATTPTEWEALLELNLMAPYLVTRAFLPRMSEQRYGRIVFVGSLAGVNGEPLIWSPAYCAAKAAVLGLARQLAIEFGPFGINVNAVAQCDVLTERTYEHFASGQYPETEEAMKTRYLQFPLRRPAQPEDVAGPICFLCSDDAQFITGETVVVSGGSSIFP
jgi:NAD(P)-dependent dehydrogenase (short-subunit alcohol dehydrogenase family)